MGTRGITWVVKDGERKVGQYGQWDHYPSGQGITALTFARNPIAVAQLRANVDGIPAVTDADWASIYEAVGIPKGSTMMNLEQGEKMAELYPEVVRDTGAQILQLIADGKVRFLVRHAYPITEDDKIWIEGQYTIDLDVGEFRAEYGDLSKSWPLNALPDDATFLKEMGDSDD
jgi:hypothetical protein